MFKRRISHLNRYREIATAFAKHGFGFILHDVGLLHVLSLPKRLATDHRKGDVNTRAERIRFVLEDLGPTFVKLGQLLSLRPDLVPQSVIDELEKLQDHVRQFSLEEAEDIIEEELGEPIEDLFARFDEHPLAAASIGQAYSAQLKTGEEVVIKIQRPDISNNVETDIGILKDIARLIEYQYEWGKHYRVRDIMDELANTLRDELDYLMEGRNTEVIRQQFEQDDRIRIPRIHWEYTSKRVLAMERIEGRKIRELDETRSAVEKREVARTLVKAYLNQLLLEGFFHGDPHPGNVFVLPENKLAFIDFGQVGSLSEEMRYHLSSIIISMMKNDTDGVKQAVLEMCSAPSTLDHNRLRVDIDLLRQRYYDVPLSEIRLGEAVNDLLTVVSRHGIRIPKDYTLMAKGLITIESIASDLHPQLSLLELAEPYGKELLKERYHPKNVAAQLWKEVSDYGEVILDLPNQIRGVLSKAQKGKLGFEMNLPQIDVFLHKLDRVSNRLSFSITLLAFSIIIVGLIIGSTFGHDESFITTIPAIEIGFIVASFMFVWLLYSILRSGRF